LQKREIVRVVHPLDPGEAMIGARFRCETGGEHCTEQRIGSGRNLPIRAGVAGWVKRSGSWAVWWW
jgi:hypothetical protein